ncbi:F-box/kelch-repeat protein At3g06240-like [Bidens hawaiensis]|uniref:F-box/kelch-repeat protein At3g06240-like n=1 Tax=Bidens hawaiensis TaxID=980011 RepID=UPI00404A35F4
MERDLDKEWAEREKERAEREKERVEREKLQKQVEEIMKKLADNKLIGARYYNTERAEHKGLSARDIDGDDTHIASIVAARVVNNASLLGYANRTARGGVPSARIAVYKMCYHDGCAYSDILAAFDDAIADKVDIISFSARESNPLNYFEDPIAIGAFHSMTRLIKLFLFTTNSTFDRLLGRELVFHVTQLTQSSMADSQYLPEHIMREIFLRMPTKPIVRLTCLSKHWHRVISDPKFMKLRSRRMLFLPSLPFHAIDSRDQSMFKPSPPLINREDYEEVTIVGSFNGIVLVVLKYCKTIVVSCRQYNRHMILYNPLSGEFKTVPDPPSFRAYNNYVYGFGYGTTRDDLKIVRLKDDSILHLKSYEVFSLKTWSWSAPSQLTGDYCFTGSYSGMFVNGFLYWNAKTETRGVPVIVALDLKKMVFSEIEIPDDYWLYRLGTYNEQLCMVCSQLDDGYELRVMNEHEHDFGKSWLVCWFGSLFTFEINHSFSFGALCILDDGKLLRGMSAKELVIHDMVKDSYKEVNSLTGFGHKGKLQSVEYVESLISPSDICSV